MHILLSSPYFGKNPMMGPAPHLSLLKHTVSTNANPHKFFYYQHSKPSAFTQSHQQHSYPSSPLSSHQPIHLIKTNQQGRAAIRKCFWVKYPFLNRI